VDAALQSHANQNHVVAALQNHVNQNSAVAALRNHADIIRNTTNQNSVNAALRNAIPHSRVDAVMMHWKISQLLWHTCPGRNGGIYTNLVKASREVQFLKTSQNHFMEEEGVIDE